MEIKRYKCLRKMTELQVKVMRVGGGSVKEEFVNDRGERKGEVVNVVPCKTTVMVQWLQTCSTTLLKECH